MPRADDRDDDDDERPRRKAGRGGDRPSGKKTTIAYILGLLVAAVFLAGALAFLGWRAGLFAPKTEDQKEVVDDGKEPEYVPPDPRIAAGRKETTGPDGERVAATQRIRLTLNGDATGPDAAKVVIDYQVVVGPSLGANDRLIAVEADRMYVVDVAPTRDSEDPKRGSFTVPLTGESRRKIKKFWVAILMPKEDDVKKSGVRVSDVVAMP
jgi:hypothetical protein